MRVDKRLKDAIKSSIKARVAWRNDGMFYKYDTTRSEKELLWRNDVRVGNRNCHGDWEVHVGNELVATAPRRFGKRSRELLPKLEWL